MLGQISDLYTSMTDEPTKYVDVGGNVWYMGKWYKHPFKFIPFGSECIYEEDYRNFDKSQYMRDLVKYPLKCGPELGGMFWAVIKAISYGQSKVDYYLQFKNNFAEIVPYLEYGLKELKNEKKGMEYKSTKELATNDGVVKEYDELMITIDATIETIEKLIA